jgi:hypothetical protein
MGSSVPIARRRGYLRHRNHNREAIPRRREDLQARLLRRVPLRHPAILPHQATLPAAGRTALADPTAEEVVAAIRVALRTGPAERLAGSLFNWQALSSLGLPRSASPSCNSAHMIGFMCVDANLIR